MDNNYMFETWSTVLTRSFQDIWLGVAAFLPKLIVAILIFVVGWVVGVLLARVIAQIVRSLKVDMALKSTGIEEVLNKAGFNLDSGRFLGELVKWFFIVVFLIATLEVLGLTQVNMFLQDVVLAFLPQVIAAAIILLVAAVLGEAVRKLVIGAAKAAEVGSATFLGGLAKWAIWVFAILVAMAHVGIGEFFAQTLFTGFVIALAIGLGLAFGLGGQGAAGEFIAKLRKDLNNHHG